MTKQAMIRKLEAKRDEHPEDTAMWHAAAALLERYKGNPKVADLHELTAFNRAVPGLIGD